MIVSGLVSFLNKLAGAALQPSMQAPPMAQPTAASSQAATPVQAQAYPPAAPTASVIRLPVAEFSSTQVSIPSGIAEYFLPFQPNSGEGDD